MHTKIKHILFFIFFLTSILSAQEEVWNVNGKMKYPVSGARAIVHNNFIYIIGGYSDSLQANVKWIQRFDPVSGDWTIVANMIEKRYGFVSGVYNDTLYIYGGINEVNDNAIIMEEWDFESPTTSIFATNDYFDRVFSTGIINNNSFIMIGGYAASIGASAELPYITNFDFQSLQINSLDDSSYLSNELPIQQMSVKAQNKLFIFGGAFNGVMQNFDIINLYDYSNFSYEAKVISPRAAGAAVYVENLEGIYLIGGYNEAVSAISSTEIITNLYSSTPAVYGGAQLNYPRKNLSAVVFEDTIYIFGGEDAAGEVVGYIETIYFPAVTAFENDSAINDFELNQNYPNPFNPETNISYTLKNAGDVRLEIFNSLGVKVKTLIKGYTAPGRYNVRWNGVNFSGNLSPTGIYFYRLSTEDNFITKKMLLLK